MRTCENQFVRLLNDDDRNNNDRGKESFANNPPPVYAYYIYFSVVFFRSPCNAFRSGDAKDFKTKHF
jgi:hypothetical protein